MKKEEDPICYCFGVFRDEIVEVIKKHNVMNLHSFRQHCDASMGCGTCSFEVEEIIEEVQKVICRPKLWKKKPKGPEQLDFFSDETSDS